VPTKISKLARLGLVIALCTASGFAAGAALAHARDVTASLPAMHAKLPFVLAQNAFTPFSLPETAEPAVSPINPGTLPGSTAAIGGSAVGTNPITGLPCNGSGSIAVSGAGGLPGTATPPPDLSTETLDQIPVGAPPVTSIYGSQNNLGSC
jgi:hypothetical protein